MTTTHRFAIELCLDLLAYQHSRLKSKIVPLINEGLSSS
jgi:hypothetical protein